MDGADKRSQNGATGADTEETADRLYWPPLIAGVLVRRYQRFLADVRLENGSVVTAHCPNTGSMVGCSQAGRPVYLSHHPDPRRKTAHSWELIDMPTSLVGINTLIPNRLAARSIASGKINELAGYAELAREVTVTPHSRFDLRLTHDGRRPCLVEIKNCTLVEGGVAYFPDAVTKRGLKHVAHMTALAAKGFRCVLFFCIQRMDAGVFVPADSIDPAYGRALRDAARQGVDILAYDVDIDLQSIGFRRRLPCRLTSGDRLVDGRLRGI